MLWKNHKLPEKLKFQQLHSYARISIRKWYQISTQCRFSTVASRTQYEKRLDHSPAFHTTVPLGRARMLRSRRWEMGSHHPSPSSCTVQLLLYSEYAPMIPSHILEHLIISTAVKWTTSHNAPAPALPSIHSL